MPPRSERKQNLLNFAREEIDNFKSGTITRISSPEELGSRFDYKADTVTSYLSIEGIGRKRKLLRRENPNEMLLPSRELVWMLGILTGGGHVETTNWKVISISDSNDVLLQSVKDVGERLFKTNAATDEKNKRIVLFHNVSVARQLGDLRSDRSNNTISEEHSWLLAENYIWSFIEGFFEKKGSVIDSGRSKRIIFYTTHIHIANFLAELLVRAGVENPRIMFSLSRSTGIKGVSVSSLLDIKLIADNIHSKINAKEQKLELFRHITPQRPLVNRVGVSSDEEVVHEWRLLRQLLGRSPKVEEIRKLKKEGKTRYSDGVYSYRFVRDYGKRDFNRARENLERIVFIQDINSSLMQYEAEKGIQIGYIPKVHRQSEEEAKAKLNQITGYTEQTSIPQVLYSRDGESIIFPSPKTEDRETQRYAVDSVTRFIVAKESEKDEGTSKRTKFFHRR